MTEHVSREFFVVANPSRTGVVDILERLAVHCAKAGIGVRVSAQGPAGREEEITESAEIAARQLSEFAERTGTRIWVLDPSDNDAHGCELVMVLGGDGTFLRGAEVARNANIPVFGLNLGHIGFMAEAEADSLDAVADTLVCRTYRVEERMTLDVQIRVDERVVSESWALNEASIENRSRQGLLEIVMEIDGRPVSGFACDGILVSTPTGSTAYAFSAGGPVLWPELEAILVVPNNAHALFARPMVVRPESVVAVEVEGSGKDAVVFCDGRRTLEVPAGGRIDIVQGSQPVKWIRTDDNPFTDRLVRKFELPVTGWRGRGEVGNSA